MTWYDIWRATEQYLRAWGKTERAQWDQSNKGNKWSRQSEWDLSQVSGELVIFLLYKLWDHFIIFINFCFPNNLPWFLARVLPTRTGACQTLTMSSSTIDDTTSTDPQAFAKTAFAFAGFSNRAASSHTSCKAKQSTLENAYKYTIHLHEFFFCRDHTWNLTRFSLPNLQNRFPFRVIIIVSISETLPSRRVSKQMLSFGSSLFGQCLHPWAISWRADCTCQILMNRYESRMVIAPKWWNNEPRDLRKMLPFERFKCNIAVALLHVSILLTTTSKYLNLHTMYNQCTVL